MTDTDTNLFENSFEEPISDGLYTGEEEVAPETPFADESKPPDRRGARASGESILSTIWFAIGGVLVGKGIDPPVGRCIQLEAPLAAQEIDKVIAGTFIDRVLQPLFRKGDQLEGLGAIIGLPVMVALYERKPGMGPLLEQPMKDVLENVLLDVVPLMNKQKAKFRRTARQLSDVHEAFNIPLSVSDPNDPRKKVKVNPADYIFANWVFQDAADLEPEPEDNGVQPKFN